MNTKKERGKIDWMITLVPLAIVIALCVLFFFCTGTIEHCTEPDPFFLW